MTYVCVCMCVYGVWCMFFANGGKGESERGKRGGGGERNRDEEREIERREGEKSRKMKRENTENGDLQNVVDIACVVSTIL